MDREVPAVVRGAGLDLDEVLRAAEDAAPVESDVVARNLEKRLGASDVSFLFVDVIGQEVVRLPRDGAAAQPVGEAERVSLTGSKYDRVLRNQCLLEEDDGQGGCRIVAPGRPRRR